MLFRSTDDTCGEQTFNFFGAESELVEDFLRVFAKARGGATIRSRRTMKVHRQGQRFDFAGSWMVQLDNGLVMGGLRILPERLMQVLYGGGGDVGLSKKLEPI